MTGNYSSMLLFGTNHPIFLSKKRSLNANAACSLFICWQHPTLTKAIISSTSRSLDCSVLKLLASWSSGVFAGGNHYIFTFRYYNTNLGLNFTNTLLWSCISIAVSLLSRQSWSPSLLHHKPLTIEHVFLISWCFNHSPDGWMVCYNSNNFAVQIAVDTAHTTVSVYSTFLLQTRKTGISHRCSLPSACGWESTAQIPLHWFQGCRTSHGQDRLALVQKWACASTHLLHTKRVFFWVSVQRGSNFSQLGNKTVVTGS